MMVKYNKETNLLYVHFVKGIPNIQIQTEFEDINKFVSKKDRNYVVGYEIEEVSKNFNLFFEKFPLNSKQKLAIVLCYLRGKKDKTQKEFANQLGMSESSYKKLENAEHNITFDILDRILITFKEEEKLSEIFKSA